MWKTLVCVTFVFAGIAALPVASYAQQASIELKQSEELAQQAFEAYSKGDYTSAISLYKKAYQTYANGVVLFNIANILDRKLKDKEQALDYYQRYLRSGDTEPGLVKRASERIEVVRAEIEAGKQAQSEDGTPSKSTVPRPSSSSGGDAPGLQKSLPPPPPEPRSPYRIAGLATIGVGAGAMVLGSVYGFMAKSKNDDASKVCNGNVCPDPKGLDLTRDARQAAKISTISFIAGGVLVASGIGLIIWGPKKEKRTAAASIQITPQVDQPGLAISGNW